MRSKIRSEPFVLPSEIELSTEEGIDYYTREKKRFTDLLEKHIDRKNKLLNELRGLNSTSRSLYRDRGDRFQYLQERKERIRRKIARETDQIDGFLEAIDACRCLIARVPLNFIFTSSTIEHNGFIEIYLGDKDPKIGKANHGHFVLNSSNEVKYCRLPFEPRGAARHVEPPLPIDVFWLQYFPNSGPA